MKKLRKLDPESEKIARLYAGLSRESKEYIEEYMQSPRRHDVFRAYARVPVRDRRAVEYLLEGLRPAYEAAESAMYSEMEYE